MQKMNPVELAKTIYLGDRAVKAVFIDGWARTVKIQIDVISRIRSQDGRWDFYTAEDIEDGFLVLTGVASLVFDPPGAIPSDYVVDFQVVEVSESDFSGYKIQLMSADVEGLQKGKADIFAYAEGLYLEDPRFPGKQIQ